MLRSGVGALLAVGALAPIPLAGCGSTAPHQAATHHAAAATQAKADTCGRYTVAPSQLAEREAERGPGVATMSFKAQGKTALV